MKTFEQKIEDMAFDYSENIKFEKVGLMLTPSKAREREKISNLTDDAFKAGAHAAVEVLGVVGEDASNYRDECFKNFERVFRIVTEVPNTRPTFDRGFEDGLTLGRAESEAKIKRLEECCETSNTDAEYQALQIENNSFRDRITALEKQNETLKSLVVFLAGCYQKNYESFAASHNYSTHIKALVPERTYKFIFTVFSNFSTVQGSDNRDLVKELSALKLSTSSLKSSQIREIFGYSKEEGRALTAGSWSVESKLKKLGKTLKIWGEDSDLNMEKLSQSIEVEEEELEKIRPRPSKGAKA